MYQNQGDVVEQLQQRNNQISQFTQELDSLNELYQQSLTACNSKDLEIRELEHENDDLRQQLETQSFDIFFKVREEVAQELEEKSLNEMKHLMEDEDGLKNFEEKIKGYLDKYT